MQEFQLGSRKVGPSHPPLVVPEIGINHEGSFEKAIQMVDAAAEMGAEIVKFQCHITEDEMIPTDMKPGGISDERLWDIIKRCEFTDAEELRLKESRIQELEDRTHEIEKSRQELMKALHGQSGSLARQPHEIVEEPHALTQMIDHQASVGPDSPEA